MDHIFVFSCKLTEKPQNGNENCTGVKKSEPEHIFIEGRNDRQKSRKEYAHVLRSGKDIFIRGIKRCQTEQY